MKKNMLVKIVILLTITVSLSACYNGDSSITRDDSELDKSEFETTFIHADIYIFEDIEDMRDMATHIIRGEVLDHRFEWINTNLSQEALEQILIEYDYTDAEIEEYIEWSDFEPIMELMTIYRVRILEVFQGDHDTESVIEVAVVGGEYENQLWILDEAVELEIGGELILFLAAWETEELYSPLSHIQSIYYIPNEIKDEYITEIEDEYFELELENINEIDPIAITIEDLIEIAEENDLLDE